MHVAIVSEELCHPPTTGGRIRILNLMQRMARTHRITYLCHAHHDQAINLQAKKLFSAWGIDCVLIASSPRKKHGAFFYARLAVNLLSSVPYAVASHNCRLLRAAIRELEDQGTIDLWQFEWLAYADALRLPESKALLIAHNIESMIWQRYCEVEHRPIHRWYLRQQLHKFTRLERKLFSRVDGVVAVSQSDAEIARSHFCAGIVHLVENGVDVSHFDSSLLRRKVRQILFLGSLDWRPNLDAIRLLLDRIFPAVVAKEPEAQLCIVGRSPPKWVMDGVEEMANVELLADVPDVRPFLATSGVMAVPLRIGGGTRLKILEALASGLPVVSTTVGCEGLGLVPGKEITIADGCDDMTQALVEAMRNPSAAAETARLGRLRVLANHDWDLLAEKLDRVWRTTIKKDTETVDDLSELTSIGLVN